MNTNTVAQTVRQRSLHPCEFCRQSNANKNNPLQWRAAVELNITGSLVEVEKLDARKDLKTLLLPLKRAMQAKQCLSTIITKVILGDTETLITVVHKFLVGAQDF